MLLALSTVPVALMEFCISARSRTVVSVRARVAVLPDLPPPSSVTASRISTPAPIAMGPFFNGRRGGFEMFPSSAGAAFFFRSCMVKVSFLWVGAVYI